MTDSVKNASRKSILIVTDRSDYFAFLGSILERDYDVHYLAVWERDEIELTRQGKEFISLPKLLLNLNYDKEEAVLTSEEIEKALECDLQQDILHKKGINCNLIKKKGNKYSIELARCIEANGIDLVIVQNDSWSYASIPLAVARKKGTKTLVFEDGFFRPDTIVLDEKGVNFTNSAPRERSFYDNIDLDQEKYQAFLKEEKSKVSRPRVRFPIKLWQVLGIIKHPLERPVTIFKELVMYFKALLGKGPRDVGDYVLLPLQVFFDSQILCHSSIKSMEELVNICISALSKYNRRAKKPLALIVKEHPIDARIVKIQKLVEKLDVKVYFLRYADVRKLIKESRLVITINSTVGIEGMLFDRPVITLGKAFYNIDSLVHHCDNHDELDSVIEKSLDTPINKDLVDKFLYYLKFIYQIDGELNKPDEENIKPVIRRIKEVID